MYLIQYYTVYLRLYLYATNKGMFYMRIFIVFEFFSGSRNRKRGEFWPWVSVHNISGSGAQTSWWTNMGSHVFPHVGGKKWTNHLLQSTQISKLLKYIIKYLKYCFFLNLIIFIDDWHWQRILHSGEFSYWNRGHVARLLTT